MQTLVKTFTYDELIKEDQKYSSLCDEVNENESVNAQLSDADRKMVEWFHTLPENVQTALSGLWS